MIQLLCEELAQRIRAAELVELAGGLASAWQYNDKSKNTKAVFWDYQQEEHVNLVPDADKAAIVYFEEAGSTQIISQPKMYKADLLLIGWINTRKGANALQLIEKLQQALKGNYHTENFRNVMVKFTDLLPGNQTLFNSYKYDQAVKKYLHKPYDSFGLRMSVGFSICTPPPVPVKVRAFTIEFGKEFA